MTGVECHLAGASCRIYPVIVAAWNEIASLALLSEQWDELLDWRPTNLPQRSCPVHDPTKRLILRHGRKILQCVSALHCSLERTDLADQLGKSGIGAVVIARARIAAHCFARLVLERLPMFVKDCANVRLRLGLQDVVGLTAVQASSRASYIAACTIGRGVGVIG